MTIFGVQLTYSRHVNEAEYTIAVLSTHFWGLRGEIAHLTGVWYRFFCGLTKFLYTAKWKSWPLCNGMSEKHYRSESDASWHFWAFKASRLAEFHSVEPGMYTTKLDLLPGVMSWFTDRQKNSCGSCIGIQYCARRLFVQRLTTISDIQRLWRAEQPQLLETEEERADANGEKSSGRCRRIRQCVRKLYKCHVEICLF